MNNTVGLLLVAYSLVLAGLSYLVYHLTPAIALPTLIAGLAGGVLCLVWGARAVAGSGGKALLILTLIPVSYALMTQAFAGWSKVGEGIQGGGVAAALITLLPAFSLGMLVRIAWSGVVFDVKPAKTANAANKRP